MRKSTGDRRRSSGVSGIYSALDGEIPQFLALVSGPAEDFDRLTVYHRGLNDVLGVLKRYSHNGDLQVLFGSGPDFVSMLLALEGSMQANKWRKEKPAPWQIDK